MPDTPIEFVTEDIDFQINNEDQVRNWLANIIRKHEYDLENLTYIFCSDEYLHQINLDYLNHDTFTDIITFDNADESGVIESDIFISIDRIKENAATYQTEFLNELHRVMAHGLLHLLGFDDKDSELKNQMRQEEDKCLSLRNF